MRGGSRHLLGKYHWADTANEAVTSCETLGRPVCCGAFRRPSCSTLHPRDSAAPPPTMRLGGNRRKEVPGFAGWSQPPPSPVDAARWPPPQDPPQQGGPTSALHVLSPFLKTAFLLSSERHSWRFCVNADRACP